jgi:gamma-glutamyltranspeptidase/glutathione hydrolase
VQPGRGVSRPRGLKPDETLTPSAQAAAPRSLAALALLHAYGGKRPLGAAARHAALVARRAGAAQRAALLDALERHGAAALRSGEVVRALLAAAGPAAGGLLSEEDLVDPVPGDQPLRFSREAARDEGAEVSLPPFPSSGEAPRPADLVFVAADRHGQVVALVASPDADGLWVPELELSLPRDADPVRRGVPRVTPGTPRPMAVPAALVRRPRDGWYAAVALQGARSLDPAALPVTAVNLSDQLLTLKQGAEAALALAASVVRQRTSVTRV